MDQRRWAVSRAYHRVQGRGKTSSHPAGFVLLAALGIFAGARCHPPNGEVTADGSTEVNRDLFDGSQRDTTVGDDAAAPAEPDPVGNCPTTEDSAVGLLVSPSRPVVGSRVRILAAWFSAESLSIHLEPSVPFRGAPGHPETTVETRDGVPAASLVQWVPDRAGDYRVIVRRGGVTLRSSLFTVAEAQANPRPGPPGGGGLWPVARTWEEGEEALYSAWIREMFHAPPGTELTYGRLDEATADPERNLLFDALGWNEDSSKSGGLHLEPDCADTPYFLRAYFAYKRQLPFGYRICSLPRPTMAPRCGSLQAIAPGVLHASGTRSDLTRVQEFFSHTLPDGVHTGNALTAYGDDASDFYPVGLTPRGLRPGTIYVDPYGHVLTLVERFRGERGRPGILYAVDGQPDGTITRKRFWEGSFLFNADPALGGSGFKAFRPISVRSQGGRLRVVSLRDEAILRPPGLGDFSTEQAGLTPDQFYDRVARLVSPDGYSPLLAQEEEVRALAEAARLRVRSIANCEKYFAAHPGVVIDMPHGHGIFEARGLWEEYSSPARDMRLLTAIRVVGQFGEKVSQSPDASGVRPGPALDALKAKLRAERDRMLRDPEIGFTYTRSDGTPWTLSLAELTERAESLEIAYNPNDCPEVRWGATEGSSERSTCKRRAPAHQQRKLEAYRIWFRERRWPARGDPGPAVP